MTLADLAIGCFVYSAMTFDGGYEDFLHKTGPTLDLTQEQHRKSLLRFLNNWGCRQFAVAHHDQAAHQIEEWHNEFGGKLFPPATDLLTLTAVDLNIVEAAYNGLVSRLACKKKLKGRDEVGDVRFGPVGTAKVFFALRPNALMPWDNAILDALGLDGSAGSYRQHLLRTRDWLNHLSGECQKHGFALADLPTMVGRPRSTLPKLIDEYLWVTITNKCQLPTKETFERWAKWS
jgi:hypothetical protein